MIKKLGGFFLTGLLLGSFPAFGAADDAAQRLVQCLRHAEGGPDQAFAEAESWLKQGGGDRARLCRAFARFHRGDYALAAQEFAVLGKLHEEKDAKHAAVLHAQAALAFRRANDNMKADIEYTRALRLEPQDVDVWVSRATERAAQELFWDALDDVNRALALMPDRADAVRLRGQIWVKLGQDSNARADFERAAMLEESPSSPAKSSPQP